jgi:hypothetical protein
MLAPQPGGIARTVHRRTTRPPTSALGTETGRRHGTISHANVMSCPPARQATVVDRFRSTAILSDVRVGAMDGAIIDDCASPPSDVPSVTCAGAGTVVTADGHRW